MGVIRQRVGTRNAPRELRPLGIQEPDTHEDQGINQSFYLFCLHALMVLLISL